MAAPPSVNNNGTVNNASSAAGTNPLAPGTIAAIFGTNLNDGSSNPFSSFGSDGTLLTTLGGASVTFNGFPLLCFLPSRRSRMSRSPRMREHPRHGPGDGGGVASAPQTVPLGPDSPGIFTIPSGGAGQGAIQIANTMIFAAPSGIISGAQAQPANPGHFLTIYCTGLGAGRTRRPPARLRPRSAFDDHSHPSGHHRRNRGERYFHRPGAGFCRSLSGQRSGAGGVARGQRRSVALTIGGQAKQHRHRRHFAPPGGENLCDRNRRDCRPSFLSGSNAFALPQFMARFSQDPFSRPEYRNQCSTCHINPKGGGPRNPFGAAFEKNKHIVTPEFRRAWPDRFLASLTSDPVPAGQGEMKATILGRRREHDSGDRRAAIPLEYKTGHAGKDRAGRGCQIDGGAASARSRRAETAAQRPADLRPLSGEPSHYLPYERGAFSLRFSHRFEQGVLNCGQNCAGIGELYGLDSFSLSSFGGELGITRRLAATVYRSPVNKTIEMGGVFQLLRQKGREPLSASFRVTVEGRDNFQDHYTTNLVFPVSRSISNIAEVFVDPMVGFNSNPFALPAAPSVPLGITRCQSSGGWIRRQHPHPAAHRLRHGVESASVRLPYGGLPQHLLFRPLRSTNAHVFELVLSNTVATTTSQAVSFGLDQLSLGFNIYRRVR